MCDFFWVLFKYLKQIYCNEYILMIGMDYIPRKTKQRHQVWLGVSMTRSLQLCQRSHLEQQSAVEIQLVVPQLWTLISKLSQYYLLHLSCGSMVSSMLLRRGQLDFQEYESDRPLKMRFQNVINIIFLCVPTLKFPFL